MTHKLQSAVENQRAKDVEASAKVDTYERTDGIDDMIDAGYLPDVSVSDISEYLYGEADVQESQELDELLVDAILESDNESLKKLLVRAVRASK